jgi:hypothetical protein
MLAVVGPSGECHSCYIHGRVVTLLCAALYLIRVLEQVLVLTWAGWRGLLRCRFEHEPFAARFVGCILQPVYYATAAVY